MRGDLDSDWSKNERSHFEVQKWAEKIEVQNLENLVKSGPAKFPEKKWAEKIEVQMKDVDLPRLSREKWAEKIEVQNGEVSN